MQNRQQLHQQKLVQELELRIQQMLQEQENRLKAVFTTQISALAATINILMEVSNNPSDLGVSLGHVSTLHN